MRGIAAIVALVLAGTAADAQPARVTSAYTNLDLDKCTNIDAVEEPQSFRLRCKGYAGIPLFVQNGDDRYDVDAGREDADELWADGFDYPGATVEWRLSRGKPFAIIYRLNSANPEAPKWSRLVVETIGRTAPGCRVASIDGRARDANVQARRAADLILSGPRRCLKPE
jgi:hypothetical protein